MTKKEKFVMERAESLYKTENISMTEAAKIAIQEWEWKQKIGEEGKEIDHFFRVKGSVCQNCRFRKEIYKEIPKECKECGFLSQRSKLYFVVLPSLKESEGERENEMV